MDPQPFGGNGGERKGDYLEVPWNSNKSGHFCKDRVDGNS